MMGAGDEEAEGLPASLLVTKVEGKDQGGVAGHPGGPCQVPTPSRLLDGLWESQKGQIAKARNKSTEAAGAWGGRKSFGAGNSEVGIKHHNPQKQGECLLDDAH